jgi:hypothetical protein
MAFRISLLVILPNTPKADIPPREWCVGYWSKADICSALGALIGAERSEKANFERRAGLVGVTLKAHASVIQKLV